MTESPHTTNRPSDAIDIAQAVTDAMEQLRSTTRVRAVMTPADVSTVLQQAAHGLEVMDQS